MSKIKYQLTKGEGSFKMVNGKIIYADNQTSMIQKDSKFIILDPNSEVEWVFHIKANINQFINIVNIVLKLDRCYRNTGFPCYNISVFINLLKKEIKEFNKTQEPSYE